MTIEVKVPMLPESVADATVLTWLKKAGDSVQEDETIVELETDKVVLEVPAPKAGKLTKIFQKEGDTVLANDILALIEPGTVTVAAENKSSSASREEAPVSKASAASEQNLENISPAVKRMIMENDINVSQLTGSGKDGRIVKEDVLKYIQQGSTESKAPQARVEVSGERSEKRVPMSRLRAKIAERLVMAQQQSAMLTTFNEVNLKSVMDLRSKYKDEFEKHHGVKLGFMSFFTKAVIEALKRFPGVNASIDNNDVIYHNYFDIGIAVSTERGLVVPVLRDADGMNMPQIETSILQYAERARSNKLSIEDMQGGTFTITNGGVFGSLLSTPIINPPQVAILGMHKIEQRPIVENGEIVIRPMMYLALTYDHRIIDGKESVQFLVTIKEVLEDPARLLIDV